MNWMVIAFATLWLRFVKVATPLTAVTLVVPWSVPAPPSRVAVTTVVLSAVNTLPFASRTNTTGCWAKATPAVGADDGCCAMTSTDAAPAPTAKLLDVPSASRQSFEWR